MKRLLIVGVILLVVAAAYFSFRPSPSPRGDLPALLALAPAESSWLVYLDFEAWRASPLRKQLEHLIPDVPEEPEYQQFVAQTGFDYARDLDRALIAFLPIEAVQFQVVAFAEGRFDQKRITAYARGHARQETQNGRELFIASATRMHANEKSARQILFAFLEMHRVVLVNVPSASPELLVAARNIVAARQDAVSGSSAVVSRMQRAAGAPLSASGDAATVSQLFKQVLQGSPLAGHVQTLLENVQWLTLAARPEQDGLRVSLLGECESVWKAGQIAVVLEALRVLGRSGLDDPLARGNLTTQQAALLHAVLQTTTVNRDQKVVEVRLQVPYALLSSPAGGNARTQAN